MAATTPPVTPKTSTATPSLYNQALAQAKAALQAQINPLNQQIAGNDANATLQEGNAASAAQGAAGLLGGIAPDIQHTYETAANDQSAFGKGFSQALQDTLSGQDNSLNSLLDRLGNPGSRLDPTQASKAADVLYGIGGYIPATSFSNEGAAQVAAAQKLPGIAILQGQVNSGAIAQSAAAQDATLHNQIATLAGKLPGDVETNYQKLQTIALNDAKFRAQLAKDKVTAAQAQQRINVSVQSLNLRAQQFAFSQWKTSQQLKLDWAKFGITQQNAQIKATANAYKAAHGGLTATQVTRYNTKLDSILAGAGPLTHAQNGVTPDATYYDKNGKVVSPSGPNGTYSSQDMAKVKKSANTNTYVNFIKAGLKAGVPLQLVLSKANATWPVDEHSDLGALSSLPAIAAAAKAQASDYQRMTGVTLGTSPNGTAITWAAPKNLSAAGKKAVQGVLQLTTEYLGTPYAWGGESPTGFDCSGLAQYVYSKEGIQIPRTTYDQWGSGLSVPKGQLQPGDLVFFKGSDSIQRGGQTLPGHVAIYIGGGNVIQAPHTGTSVQVSSLSSIGNYMGARRYVH